MYKIIEKLPNGQKIYLEIIPSKTRSIIKAPEFGKSISLLKADYSKGKAEFLVSLLAPEKTEKPTKAKKKAVKKEATNVSLENLLEEGENYGDNRI